MRASSNMTGVRMIKKAVADKSSGRVPIKNNQRKNLYQDPGDKFKASLPQIVCHSTLTTYRQANLVAGMLENMGYVVTIFYNPETDSLFLWVALAKTLN